MSIQKDPDKRDLRYLRLVTQRLEGRTDTEIAKGMDIDPPEALYQLLAQDGFPICPVCGAAHAGANHCEEKRRRRLDRCTG
jgi:hypothetical protein